MPPVVPEMLVLLAAYLAGSVPFGLLLGRLRGIDIRAFGSGNIGATNLGRALGKEWFVVCFVLDAAKGALPVLLLAPLAGETWPEGALAVSTALAAVLGHCFSVWLRFRGGKGVATTAGAIGAISPAAAGAALIVFVIVFVASRYVSLASMVAAIAFPALAHFLDGRPAVLVFAAAIALLVVLQHRTNVVRLFQGTEPRIPLGKRAGDSPPAEVDHGN